MEFEWDVDKARSNANKHRVSFYEASEVFNDDYSLTVADPDHSFDEQRYLIFGKSNQDRYLVVSYTERNSRIRIISARLMTSKERKAYEQ
jgi:uncharacterized DUF497 family protein